MKATLEYLRENMRAESQQYEDTMDRMTAVLTPRQQAQVCFLYFIFISSFFFFLPLSYLLIILYLVLSACGVPAWGSHPAEERLGGAQGQSAG